MNERTIPTETEYGAVLSQQTGFERRMVVLLVFSTVSADAAARSVLQLPSLPSPLAIVPPGLIFGDILSITIIASVFVSTALPF